MFDMVDEAGPPQASGPARNGGGAASSQKPTRVRVEFPETWLWSDSVAGYPSAVVLSAVLGCAVSSVYRLSFPHV